MCFCLSPLSDIIVLESDDKYSLNDDGSELIIKDVKKVDEGDYTCIARNKAGEKEEEVSLNVFGESKIITINCGKIMLWFWALELVLLVLL